METANDIVRDALQEILVQADEAPLEPNETQAAIRYMNRYMQSMAAKGVNLGYTIVTSLTDNITIPDGANLGLVLNLAKYLAPQYDKAPPSKENIRDAEFAMYALSVQVSPGRYPSIMPIGSGNEQDLQGDRHFYPEGDDTILTEQGGNVNLEENT